MIEYLCGRRIMLKDGNEQKLPGKRKNEKIEDHHGKWGSKKSNVNQRLSVDIK